jgi:hypothetical protein
LILEHNMKLPPVKLIKDILDGMLGRDVTMSPGLPLSSVDAIGGAVAVYIDDSSVMRAVAAWDLPAASNVGAAVGLVPARVAANAVEDRYLPENLMENLTEVSNVLAAAFQVPGNPHVRLSQSRHPIAAADNDVTTLIYSAGNRLDLDIDIAGYGKGKLAICTTL